MYPERLSCKEGKERDGRLLLAPRAGHMCVSQQLTILEPGADLQGHVVTPTRQTDVKPDASHQIRRSHDIIQDSVPPGDITN